jgi:hypothetical protein
MSEETKALIKKMRDRRTHYYDGPLFDQAANVIESLTAKSAECKRERDEARAGLCASERRNDIICGDLQAADARVKELEAVLREQKQIADRAVRETIALIYPFGPKAWSDIVAREVSTALDDALAALAPAPKGET